MEIYRSEIVEMKIEMAKNHEWYNLFLQSLDNVNQIYPDVNHFEYNPHREPHSITSFSE